MVATIGCCTCISGDMGGEYLWSRRLRQIGYVAIHAHAHPVRSVHRHRPPTLRFALYEQSRCLQQSLQVGRPQTLKTRGSDRGRFRRARSHHTRGHSIGTGVNETEEDMRRRVAAEMLMFTIGLVCKSLGADTAVRYTCWDDLRVRLVGMNRAPTASSLLRLIAILSSTARQKFGLVHARGADTPATSASNRVMLAPSS